MPATGPTYQAAAVPPGLYELSAQLNLRLLQLGWPVVAEVEHGAPGDELLVVRLTSAAAAPSGVPPLRVSAASLPRPHLIDSILQELRARHWDRAGAHPEPRANTVWCAPA